MCKNALHVYKKNIFKMLLIIIYNVLEREYNQLNLIFWDYLNSREKTDSVSVGF